MLYLNSVQSSIARIKYTDTGFASKCVAVIFMNQNFKKEYFEACGITLPTFNCIASKNFHYFTVVDT